MANPWENDPIDASATPTKAPEYEPWMSDAVDTAQTTTTQAQPEHHQKFLQNLAPLIKGAAKAAIGPSFIQAGKNIRKQFQESIKPDTIEGSPEEKTFRELGRAAGNVYGIPIEVAKGIYGTVKEGVQSLTPKPVQQAVVPAAQEVESGLGQAVQSAGNIPLPGGHKVSDIPQGAEYMYNQLSPRAKENLGAAANLAMLAPAGKGVEMLAGATEKAAPKIGKAIEGVVTPIREKAQSMAAKATENKIDTAIKTGIDKGIKPTVVGKKTLARHNKFYSDANNAVRSIADNRDKIKIIDENGEAAPHPRSAAEMAQAVDQTKQILYKQYHDMAMAAGDKGAQFEAAPVIEKIDKVGKDLKENPETRAYAESLKKEVEELQGQSPEIIEARIKDLNSSLAGFYEGRTAKAKARIDASVANLMREELDNKISGAVGEGYQDLKNKYGALKTIEKEVNHRAIVNARKAGKSVIDMTDIFTGGDLTAGVLTMNPMLIVKGVAGRGLKEIYKAINNPDRAVSQMFKKVYGFSDKSKVINRMRGVPNVSRKTSPTPPVVPPVPPQGAMRTTTIPAQEPGAVTPQQQVINAMKKGGEGGYIDLGGASAPVQVPPKGPKLPPQNIVEAIKGSKKPEIDLETQKTQQIEQLKAEKEAAEKEAVENAGLTPQEIYEKNSNKIIDKLVDNGYTYDEEKKRHVYNPDSERVERYRASLGRYGSADTRNLDKIRASVEKERISKSLPREIPTRKDTENIQPEVGTQVGAETTPQEGVPPATSEPPASGTLPESGESRVESGLTEKQKKLQEKLDRIAARPNKGRGESDVDLHDMTDNPQANRALWRDNTRRLVKDAIDHNSDRTLRDDRKEQWAYILGSKTDEIGNPIYPTERTKGILGAHAFEHGVKGYGGDEGNVQSEERLRWKIDMLQPYEDMPSTWDDVRQEIMSAEPTRKEAEALARRHVAEGEQPQHTDEEIDEMRRIEEERAREDEKGKRERQPGEDDDEPPYNKRSGEEGSASIGEGLKGLVKSPLGMLTRSGAGATAGYGAGYATGKTPEERRRNAKLGALAGAAAGISPDIIKAIRKGGKAPPGPFSKTWHELAFKKILREAAEKGYDKVAWTTGEQQAARYDLSKQVDAIRVKKVEGGYLVFGEKNGTETGFGRHAESELPGVIGKELAQKAVNDGGGTYRGTDLKVGGEGMKGFYDKILVDYANKYGKKWGAKVEDTKIPGADTHDGYELNTVHSMAITPAMRKSVLEEGQPMFAVAGGAGLTGAAAIQDKRKNKQDIINRMKKKK